MKLLLVFKQFKHLSLVLIAFSVSACSGGDSPSADSSVEDLTPPTAVCPQLPGDYTTLCVDDVARSETLAADNSIFYQFEAEAGETYSIIVNPGSGDPDVALYSSMPADFNTMIGLSVNPGTDSELIVFTPSLAAIYSIEVYAWSDSTFEISITTPPNTQPVSVAGTDQTVPRNQLVILDGFSSYDADNDPLTFEWVQVSGITVTLDNPNSATPSFISPGVESVLVFELVVHDGKDYSAADSLNVIVQNMPPVINDLALSPVPAYSTDDLTVHYNVFDLDSDTTTVSISWQKNGVVIASETSATLASANFVKDDQITVTVTASDGVLSTQSSQMITIADAPATLSVISMPTVADYGVLTNFTVAATDPDNDPVLLEILYGPSSMIIDAVTGQVSWIPDGPMFDTQMDANWAVRATSGGVSNDVTGVITINDPGRNRPIVRSGIVVPDMQNGMAVTDFDKDGNNEIIVTNGIQLYTLQFDGTDYVQEWAYPFSLVPGGKITAIQVYDLDGDGHPEIIVGGTNRLLVIDGSSRRIVREAHVDYAVIKSIEANDVDNDGRLELSFLGTEEYYPNNGAIHVFDANTLTAEWQSAAADYGTSLAVGQLDSEPYPEIVTAQGYVYGYNGTSYTNEWVYGSGFGFLVDTGDTNGDGVEEIIGAIDWTAVQAYDLASKSIIWSQVKSDIHSLAVANIDNDSADEVLIGDGQWGNVAAYSYEPTTQTVIQDWAIDSQDHSASSITVGDADNDGDLEFIWGTGITSSGEDSLVVAGLNPGIVVEWRNTNPSELGGPFIGAEWTTVGVGDDRAMFAVAQTDSGYAGTRLVSMDATGGLTISEEVGSNWNRRASLTAADYDLDGVEEVFLSTADLYDGYFTVYDFSANFSEWTSPTGLGTGVATAHADLNGDGSEDFAVLTEGGYVYVYDTLNSALIWQSGFLGSNGTDMVIHEMDGDSEPEIVVATLDKITVMQKTLSGYGIRNEVSIPDVFDMAVGDVDGDAVPEVVALSGSSYLANNKVVLLSSQLVTLSEWNLANFTESIHIEHSPHPRKNIILSVSDDLALFGEGSTYLAWYDPYQGEEISVSPYLIGSPVANSLNFVDADNDGFLQMLFGTDKAMYMTQ